MSEKLNTQSVMPAFEKNNIPIVLSSSAYYVPYMAVTIQSIIETSSPKNNYDFILIHKEISEYDQDTIRRLAMGKNNISIRFIEISNNYTTLNFNYRNDVAAAVESFYCVLLPEILKNYSKCICIDCDLVVLHDIAELYHVDVDKYMIAAVHDIDGIGNMFADLKGKNPSSIMHGRANYLIKTMGLKKIEDYFQSGVMLFNLDEWRNTYTTDEILNIACADWIQWGDQDTINILCKNRVKYLDMAWNVVVNHNNLQLKMALQYGPKYLLDEYSLARKEPKIIHYAGTKPWKISFCDMFIYFWKIACRSPFFAVIYERALKYDKQIKMQINSEPLIVAKQIERFYASGLLGLRCLGPLLIAWVKYKMGRFK